MNSLLYSSLLCFISGLLAFFYTKRLSPLCISGIFWGLAWFTAFTYRIEILLPPEYSDFQDLNDISLAFSIWGILGGWIGKLASALNVQKPETAFPEHYSEEYFDAVLKKFHWVWFVSVFLGLFRIAILLYTSKAGSFWEYRVAVLESFDSLGKIYAIPMQIAAHVYIFTGFLLVVLGLSMSFKPLNLKRLIGYFFAYSVISASMGGRIFLVDFSLLFFPAYFLRGNIHFKKKDFLHVAMAVVGILVISGFISSARNTLSEKVTFTEIFQSFSYLGEGLRTADHVLSDYQSLAGEGNGSNFFSRSFGPQISEYVDCELYYKSSFMFTVHSIMPYLYFDWGLHGMVAAWGIIMFLCQYFFEVAARRKVLFCSFAAVCLCKFAFGSILGNPFGTLFVYIIWAVAVSLLIKIFVKVPPKAA